jgi:hypothetical protein
VFNISNEKFGHLQSTRFKMFSQMRRNSINDGDFLKVHDLCWGGGAAIVITHPRRYLT